MSIRLTINLELEVIEAEAVIDGSPYNYCKAVITVARNLIGVQIAPGWTQKTKKAMGANRGCTHLTELLGPVATTAIQTIASARSSHNTGKSASRSNSFLDTCHTYAADSPVVQLHWPDQYKG